MLSQKSAITICINTYNGTNNNTVTKCGGDYIYYGIETGVLKLLSQNRTFFENNSTINLHVNVDGLPIFKSANDQMWPILVSSSVILWSIKTSKCFSVFSRLSK